MIKNSIKIAFRNLLAQPIFTTINVAGMGVGMAAALLIFIWVQNELTFDKYHQEVDQIHRVLSHLNKENTWTTVPLSLIEIAEKEVPEIVKIASVRKPFDGEIIKIKDSQLFEEKKIGYVNDEWFEILTYEVKAGTVHNFNSQLSNIALTEAQAEKLFGETSVLGEKIQIDSLTYIVSAILADNPTNSSFQFDLLLPINAFLANPENNENDHGWGQYEYTALLKLRPTAKQDAVSNQLKSIFDKNREDNKTSFSLQAIQDIRFASLSSDDFKHQNKTAVYLFALIGFLILLTACVNYISLSTALISKRTKEMGIKKVIGASFQHIFFQVLLETLLMTLAAFIVALGLVEYCLPYLSQLLEVPLETAYNHQQLGWLLAGVVLLSVLLAGSYPALVFSTIKPIRLLQKNSTWSSKYNFRQVLVVGQFSLAISLLIGTFLIYEQFHFLQTKEVGYDRSYVLEISPNLFQGDFEENVRRFDLFKEELKKMPQATAISGVGNSIIDNRTRWSGSFSWKGQSKEEKAAFTPLLTEEALMELFDFEMADGRWFDKQNELDKNNIILNETAIKQFNIPEPVVGHPITFRKQEGQIIGIVKDFHFKSLHDKINPMLIGHVNGWAFSLVARLNSSNIPNTISTIETHFKSFFPNLLFQYTFLDDSYQQLYQAEANLNFLFRCFAGILFFIACLGLFGLSTFSVEQRNKEISIRKVLGADAFLIVRLLSKEFLKLVMLAILIAIPIAWYGGNYWLDNFAYRIEISWWSFALAACVALFGAIVTVGFQALKAALKSPITFLRNE